MSKTTSRGPKANPVLAAFRADVTKEAAEGWTLRQTARTWQWMLAGDYDAKPKHRRHAQRVIGRIYGNVGLRGTPSSMSRFNEQVIWTSSIGVQYLCDVLNSYTGLIYVLETGDSQFVTADEVRPA